MLHMLVQGALMDLFISYPCNLPAIRLDLDHRAFTSSVLDPKRPTTTRWEASRPNHTLNLERTLRRKQQKVG